MTDNTQQSVKADTEYVVLKKDTHAAGTVTSGTHGWRVVQTVTARDQGAAIRTVVGEPLALEGVNGSYVAVPTRSWNPVTVTVKVEKSLVFEETE